MSKGTDIFDERSDEVSKADLGAILKNFKRVKKTSLKVTEKEGRRCHY